MAPYILDFHVGPPKKIRPQESFPMVVKLKLRQPNSGRELRDVQMTTLWA